MAALNNICKLVRSNGPLSVAQYMREVLTNPMHGYYVHKNMFGKKGDFITSPEVTQVFGELVAIWCISQWQTFDCPQNLRIVELGPGTGTMASDILRTFKCYPKLFEEKSLSYNFIEISESLSKLQWENLTDKKHKSKRIINKACEDFYHSSNKDNISLYWYRSIDHMNLHSDNFNGCTIFLAYEFFDALPIHKFVKIENTWKEIFIDVKNENELQFVVLPNSSLATALISENETREHVEISPESNYIVNQIGKYLERNNGACLIGDYGHFGTKEDTFRGFKSHKLSDVLENVGETDLTADVDFKQLLTSVNSFNLLTTGPINQGTFLKNMGIDLRTKMLMNTCDNSKDLQIIADGYKMLTSSKHMGEVFKFISFKKTNTGETTIAGFE